MIQERCLEFTGLYTSKAESLLLISTCFRLWSDPSLVLVLVLSSLFQKTTETRAGSFRATQSETLPCWSLAVISYQLLSIAAISHEQRIKAQLW